MRLSVSGNMRRESVSPPPWTFWAKRKMHMECEIEDSSELPGGALDKYEGSKHGHRITYGVMSQLQIASPLSCVVIALTRITAVTLPLGSIPLNWGR